MEIQPSNNSSPLPTAAPRPAHRTVAAATDGSEFASTAALHRALDATPDVRPEAVARGQALAESEKYPPAQTLQRLARLFAIEFGAQKPSDHQS